MSFVLKKVHLASPEKVYMSRKKVIFTAKLKTVQTVTKIKMMEMERELRLEDIYHVCTDGMSRNILFKDDKDFIKGTYDECVGFIRLYKKRMNGLLEGANTDVSVKQIDTEDYLRSCLKFFLRKFETGFCAGFRRFLRRIAALFYD